MTDEQLYATADKMVNIFRNDMKGQDANGLPMIAEHSRAAYLGCYTVHATMYMDIPDPITENENNQSK